MNKDFINQFLNNKPFDYTPRDSFELVKLTRQVNKNNYLLFLRIFREVRKKLRKGNQYDVAIEIKRIFAEFDKKGEVYPWHHNLLQKDLQNNQSIHNFLKEIGLTIFVLRYQYWNCDMYELEKYFVKSSPNAIVQMAKRLKKRI